MDKVRLTKSYNHIMSSKPAEALMLTTIQFYMASFATAAKIGAVAKQTDLAHQCEGAFTPVLDAVYKTKLRNAEALEPNSSCFDLCDDSKKIWVQVTVETGIAKKIRKTIPKFEKRKKEDKHHDYKLWFFFAGTLEKITDKQRQSKEAGQVDLIFSLGDLYEEVVKRSRDINGPDYIDADTLFEIQRELRNQVEAPRALGEWVDTKSPTALKFGLPKKKPLDLSSHLVNELQQIKNSEWRLNKGDIKDFISNSNEMQQYLMELDDDTRIVLASVYGLGKKYEDRQDVSFNDQNIKNIPRYSKRFKQISVTKAQRILDYNDMTNFEREPSDPDHYRFKSEVRIDSSGEIIHNILISDFQRYFTPDSIRDFIYDYDFTHLKLVDGLIN